MSRSAKRREGSKREKEGERDGSWNFTLASWYPFADHSAVGFVLALISPVAAVTHQAR
jgi:hypothetical protein